MKFWKLWWALTTLELNIFCWNFVYKCEMSVLKNVYKRVFEILLFGSDLELIGKLDKN